MTLWDLIQAIILGVVEGLTEFLPISSTGHLIIVSNWLGFQDKPGANTFVVAIQAGAILAVCWYYRQLIGKLLVGMWHPGAERRLVINTLIAFLPAALIGVLIAHLIESWLFNVGTVATMLILGGVILLWIEKRPSTKPRTMTMQDMTWKQALGVGVAQCFAMIPGTSRSGSTIVGGLLLGLSRQVATEFSFFLGIPTILGATVYDLWRNRDSLLAGEMNLSLLIVGLVVSFISALIVVKWLIGYVSRHDYQPFGWYRIVFGVVLWIGCALGFMRLV